MSPLGRAEVAALPGGVDRSDEVYVLQRHRLLREAGGFESLRPIRVGGEANELAVAPLAHPGEWQTDLESTRSPLSMQLPERDGQITHHAGGGLAHVQLLPGRVRVPKVVAKTVMTSVDRG